jgi:resolvase-like protein
MSQHPGHEEWGWYTEKIHPQHVERLAVVYVRQSTMQQGLAHQESTQLQYGLVRRAVAWGWSEARVLVIDDDLGRSGTRAEGRHGFQRLVAEVGVGRIRARYLMARFPNPPVRPVRETFASYGSRERDITGDVHFASSTEHSPWTALRVRWVPLYSFPTLPLRAFAMCAAFLRSDYYAPFDCL